MDKDFLPYDLAVEIKELGFNEKCYKFFEKEHPEKKLFSLYEWFEVKDVVFAPTFSQAFRWFREKYNWQSSIDPTKDQHRFELGYNYWIWNPTTGEEYFTEPMDRPSGGWVFETHEESELECLKKLIEIVKEKNE